MTVVSWRDRAVVTTTVVGVRRLADPGRDRRCVVYHPTLGYPYSHPCEVCCNPVWHHFYLPPRMWEMPLFRVKQYDVFNDVWWWQPVGQFIHVDDSVPGRRPRWWSTAP